MLALELFPKAVERINEKAEGANVERTDADVITAYMTGLSTRHRQFLGKIAFSSGKNYYIQLLLSPLAMTPIMANDSVRSQSSDAAIPDLLPFQEIGDEEIEPLASLAQNRDQLRLVFVSRAVLSHTG